MTSKNLSTVTTNVIMSYGNTAKNVINAYRVGGERMAGFVDQSWESAIKKSATRLSTEVRANALSAQRKLNSYYTKGITVTSDGADSVVSKVVELADKGVTQASISAIRFEKATGVTTLNTIAVAVVPAVEAVSKVAVKLEKQSSLLAHRVSGKSVKAKVTSVKRTVKTAAVRVRKTV